MYSASILFKRMKTLNLDEVPLNLHLEINITTITLLQKDFHTMLQKKKI